MNFIAENRYWIRNWKGKIQLLTPEQLYERVLEDSKSDYDWIAPATELVRVCDLPDFPVEYAQNIKVLILNCFANLETKKECPSHRKSTDEEAVYHCYNSLNATDDTVFAVKFKYLLEFIKAITKYDCDAVRFPIHTGPTYRKICEEWIVAKFKENYLKEEIDFKQLRKNLYADFDKTIRKAEEEGAFKEDDEKRVKEMYRLWDSMDLKSHMYMPIKTK